VLSHNPNIHELQLYIYSTNCLKQTKHNRMAILAPYTWLVMLHLSLFNTSSPGSCDNT